MSETIAAIATGNTVSAIGILRDPIRNKKLDGYFYINFGNRDFENFNQKKEV